MKRTVKITLTLKNSGVWLSNNILYWLHRRAPLAQSYQITPQQAAHCTTYFEQSIHYYITAHPHIHTCRIHSRKCILTLMLTHALCAEDQDVRICGKRDYKCAQEARARMELSLYAEAANQSATDRPSCRCLPGCSEISYAAKLSSSSLSDSFAAKERFTPLADHPVNATYFK